MIKYVILLNLLPSCQHLNESTTERPVDHQDENLHGYKIETCICPRFEHEIAMW